MDGLRALAILAVLGVHGGNVLPGGHLGVTVFFVLSGYLITGILLREHRTTGRLDLRRFYRRRLVRLYPALLVALFVGAPVLLAVGKPWAEVAAGTAAAATYTTNIVGAYLAPGAMRTLTWPWTLALEEQFYLVWPLLLLAVLRWRGRRTAGVVAVGYLLLAELLRLVLPLVGALPYRVYVAPDTRADALVLGCLVAMAGDRFGGRWWGWLVLPSSAVMGAAFLLADLQSRWTYTVWLPLTMLATTVLILALQNGVSWLVRALGVRPLAWIGRISYSIYLWNLTVYELLHALEPDWVPRYVTEAFPIAEDPQVKGDTPTAAR